MLNGQRFYPGTWADLKPGDPIEPGYTSNYGKRKKATWVYLTGIGGIPVTRTLVWTRVG